MEGQSKCGENTEAKQEACKGELQKMLMTQDHQL